MEIQALLQDKDLISKFSNDVRKYSHNYEGSLFFENYNFGTYDCVQMRVGAHECVYNEEQFFEFMMFIFYNKNHYCYAT